MTYEKIARGAGWDKVGQSVYELKAGFLTNYGCSYFYNSRTDATFATDAHGEEAWRELCYILSLA